MKKKYIKTLLFVLFVVGLGYAYDVGGGGGVMVWIMVWIARPAYNLYINRHTLKAALDMHALKIQELRAKRELRKNER